LRSVNGDEESLAASLFGMLHDTLGDLTILVHVELQPLDLASLRFVHDLVEGTRRECRDHLDDIVLSRASGQDDLSLWVAELAECCGCDVEGNVDFRAEHRGRGVDLLNVDEHARTEPDLVEGAVVLAQCLSQC
jgi:hypothetical protein